MYPKKFAQAAFVLVVWALVPLAAQDKPGQYTPERRLSVPPAGKIVIPYHPAEFVTSLRDLIRTSKLIVDGTVLNNLPTISSNPDNPFGAQTGSVVAVNEVIFGKAPASGQVLLLELGGHLGKWQASVEGDSLVRSGERYILFLAPAVSGGSAASGLLPDPATVPRYFAVGAANGKAGVSANGRVQFAPGAVARLHALDSPDPGTFLGKITGCVNELNPQPLPYPVGVTPITPPNGGIFPVKPIPFKDTKCGE